MKTGKMDLDYVCWVHMRGFKHAKGCKRTRCLRRDPEDNPLHLTVECVKVLPPEVQRRLVRLVPTEDT